MDENPSRCGKEENDDRAIGRRDGGGGNVKECCQRCIKISNMTIV